MKFILALVLLASCDPDKMGLNKKTGNENNDEKCFSYDRVIKNLEEIGAEVDSTVFLASQDGVSDECKQIFSRLLLELTKQNTLNLEEIAKIKSSDEKSKFQVKESLKIKMLETATAEIKRLKQEIRKIDPTLVPAASPTKRINNNTSESDV